ncbi:hypothetical protein H6P81_009995 [Aristolochia fimbriata]|uniref:tRNA(adenine(34)) deaminase n=1 Tax=Aristolochia fimbriata TaxID=158543 RepID=A0AAV7EMH5_ARIFI|nr:hypothetical protein H6P81_009995 [Aristolochia fimbriata]
MDTCIVTGMSFRNRGSFFSTGYYPYSERLESSCSYLTTFPVYGTTVNSRVLYGLRQSHLINWSVYRRLSLAGPGHCRLAAPCECHCDCERKYRCQSLSRERWGERRQSYILRENDVFDSSSYDSFSEMLSLLTDSGVESYVDEKNKINTRKRDAHEKERTIKVDDKHLSVQQNRKNLKKKDKFVEKGSLRKLESERLVKSIDRFRQTGKESFLKDDTYETRKDGSSSSYYTAFSEGEIASSSDFISTADQTFYRDNIVENEELKPNAKFKENLIGESSRVHKYNSQDTKVKKSQAHEDVMEISWKEDGRKPHVMETDFERYPTKQLEKATGVSGSRVSGAKKASSSQMRIVDVEETSTSYSNLVHKRKEQRVVGQKDSSRGSKVFNEAPRIQEDGTGIGSSSAKLLHVAEKDIGKTGAAWDMVEEVRKQHLHIDDQFDSRIQLKENEIVKETSEIQSSDIVKRPSFKKPYKSRVVDSKLLEDTREYMPETNIQVAEITDASEESHRLINVSETHASGTERKNDSGWMYIASDEEENLVQSAGVVNERRNEHEKIHEMISRTGLRKEHQRVSYDSDLERASSSQKIAEISKMNQVGTSSSDLNWRKGTEKHESGVPNVFERQSQPRLVLRGSRNGQESNLYETQEAFYEILDDKDVRIGTEEVSGRPAELVVKDNTIDSADRLDKSSHQVIGEFFEKAQEEMSTTKKSSVLSKEEKYIRKDQNMSVDIQITFDDTRRSSSGGPGPKGPSDEMWAEPGISSQEPSVTAPEDSSLTPVVESAGPSDAGSTVVRKSGRSLWGYIGNIVRTGWGMRAESHASSTKRSAKSSSNESASSESWFSGNEPEDDDVRKERRAAPKETIRKLPNVQPNSAPIPDTEKSTKVILQNKKADVKADPTISLSGTKLPGSSLVIQDEIIENIGDPESTGGPSTVVRSGYSTPSFPLHSESPFSSLPLTGGSSSQSISLGEKNFGISVGATIGAGVPSPVGTVDLSQPSTATSLPMSTTVAMNMSSPLMGGSSSSPESLVTSSGKKKKSNAGEIEASGSSLVESRVESGKQKQAEASGNEGKDSELKHRKLQRNKQVPKDRFDEWEAAFNLEQEQKRVDEMFMREALIEAKKAADIWEVPVGAVLVQHGKIIARGCNLVEELRDSTAHAEMICISEASGLLKTWRLSETTLYVTLEPCPMCAGAILQARIDTVVWGAPNKLLGADGSWISLFPSESDPAVPVHPFHPKMTMRRGVLATECADGMQQFFRLRRKKIKKEDPPSSHLPLSSPTKFLSKIHNIFNMMFCL